MKAIDQNGGSGFMSTSLTWLPSDPITVRLGLRSDFKNHLRRPSSPEMEGRRSGDAAKALMGGKMPHPPECQGESVSG